MSKPVRKKPSEARVARHRAKSAAAGSRRMEVTIPARDAALVKAVAGALRAGGAEARRVRDALEPVVVAPRAQTGAELLAFLRASPLVGTGLEFERDASTGRTAEFG